MPEKMPPVPFKQRAEGSETITQADEIRAVTGVFELTRRLRAKNPELNEGDKPLDDITESVGDHIAMVAYLMHYFLPLLERDGVKLNYERTLDMVLSHDIAEASQLPHVMSIKKTAAHKRDEVLNAVQLLSTLPRREGFNADLHIAYGEYIGRDTQEARFVRALNGLETMLYVLSKPDAVRTELVKGMGYSREHYRERIGTYCEEFPALQQFYTRVERLFQINGYFDDKNPQGNGVIKPEELQSLLNSFSPTLDEREIDADAENTALLRLYSLKRKLHFGQPPKPSTEHRDSDAEHVTLLLFLARYFVPAIQNDPNQKNREEISLRDVIELVLAHDAPEAITGDLITQMKTEDTAIAERQAADAIIDIYAPRAEGFNLRFGKRYFEYEMGKAAATTPSNATLMKALDVFEGQCNIYDPRTREKLPGMPMMSAEAVEKKVGAIVRLFPILAEHWDDLAEKFKKEGLW